MSFSIIVFLWRKPGLTPQEFKDYYESKHIPLFASLVGPLFPKSHTRIYPTRQRVAETASSENSNIQYPATIFQGSPDNFDFDVFISMVFENKEAFDQMMVRLTEPEIVAKIRGDEENFLLYQKTAAAAGGPAYITLQSSVHGE